MFPDISTQYFIHNASKPGRSAEKPATIETAQKKAARLKSIEADRLKGTMTKNIRSYFLTSFLSTALAGARFLPGITSVGFD